MSGNVATGAESALLKRIISEKRQRLRKNVHILFLGLTAAEADPIITLLRGARLAPRGQQVQSVEEFQNALSERSWDLILSPQVEGSFTAKEAIQILQRQGKDIPIIQLVPRSNSQSLLQGLKAKMATVISLEEQELLLIQIRRQLEHLENRRRLRTVEAQLAEAQKQSQQLATLSQFPIAYLDQELSPLFCNPAFGKVFGIEDTQNLDGQSLDKFVALKDREQLLEKLQAVKTHQESEASLELQGRRIDGSNFTAKFDLQHSRYMNQDAVQVIVQPDIKASTQSFANLDPITRLYDKSYMLSALEKAVYKALPGGADCNLLYLKFDNYDTLLSELGSKGGDIVLADIAELLSKKVNKAHIFARLEDDVFAILFHDPSPEKAAKLAELLRRAIAHQKIDVTGITVQTTCSIGICTINDNAPTYMEVLERAREAADSLNQEGAAGNGIKLYEIEHEDCEEEDAAFQLVQDALRDDKFHLLFQPIVGLASANGLGNYEVFLRMDEHEQCDISPNIFQTTQDHCETCISLDKWVIENTFTKIAEQLKDKKRSRVFINLTSRFFQAEEILTWVSDQLKQHRIPADLVAFQISESDLTTSLASAEHFSSGLKKLGCSLCIKHFGTSESSDMIRKAIKPDLIKLDGAYVEELQKSTPEQIKEFAAMISNLKKLHISSIAPMVEDTKLMGKLWKCGVDFVQGFYLQPPGPEMQYDFFE